MIRRLLFVGECRSITAQRKGWTWADGRLAAKPLFEALAAMGVDPSAHSYCNLWTDNAGGTSIADSCPGIMGVTITRIKRANSEGDVVVALGKRVSHELAKAHLAALQAAMRAYRGEG